MNNFNKVDAQLLKLGERYSSPIFFDDGDNMFLAAGKTVKAYHINAIRDWKIELLLTEGRPLKDGEEIDEGGDAEVLEEL